MSPSKGDAKLRRRILHHGFFGCLAVRMALL